MKAHNGEEKHGKTRGYQRHNGNQDMATACTISRIYLDTVLKFTYLRV